MRIINGSAVSYTHLDVYKRQHPIGVVEKCVMCKERTAQGEEPSCVKTCITKSRWFGDLDDPTSEINVMIKKLGAKPLMEDLGTKPSVYYAGLV